MRRLLSSVALLGVLGAVSCTVADDLDEPTNEEVGTTSEAITGSCTALTMGLPCDPDGPTGALQECQGYCWIGVSGNPQCLNVNAAALNGRACGSSNGVGDAACKNVCQNGSCVPSIPTGAACRPTTLSDPCEGQCNALGICQPLVNPCPYGRDDCKFNICNPANSTAACLSLNLFNSTPCDDGNECSVADKCNGQGACVPGAPKLCSDNNPCTTDACTPSTGACIHTPNTEPCSDNNACTTGDTCSAGSCKAGGPTDCDDNNACTTDTCAPATGCAHTQKNCSDNNACTADSCNPATGACSSTPVNCDDNDACTTDTCAPATGCANTPINCDDNDPCTQDSCAAGNCSNTPIPGCGVDAGTGGAGGTGGTAGSAGTAGTAGSAGSAGAAGSAGSGGAAGSAGSAGSAGAAGSAGSAGAAGSAGSAGAGGSGGTGGSGGGTGGSGGGTGGTGGSGGGTGGSGGTATGGTGGTSDAGVDGGDGGLETDDDGGCGCRVPTQSPSGSRSLALLAALAAAGLIRRRRR